MFCEWHKSPTNKFLHIVAFIVLLYGVYVHSWTWVIIAIAIAIIGHVIDALSGKKERPAPARRRRR